MCEKVHSLLLHNVTAILFHVDEKKITAICKCYIGFVVKAR